MTHVPSVESLRKVKEEGAPDLNPPTQDHPNPPGFGASPASPASPSHNPDLLAELCYVRPAFFADALCKEYPTLAWFPTKGQSCEPALQVCGRCAVLAECKAWALADPSLEHGVLGGLTAPARANARRLAQKRTTTTAEGGHNHAQR